MRYAYARCVDPFPLRGAALWVCMRFPTHPMGFPCVWGVERDHRATPTERGSHVACGNGLVVMFSWSSNPLALRTVVGGGLRTPPPTTTPTTSIGHQGQSVRTQPTQSRSPEQRVPGRDRSRWAGAGRVGSDINVTCH